MPITHVTIKAAGQTLAAIADWNADHIGTTTPENHGNEAHTSVFITGAEVPANETDPVYSAWILGPPNVSEFTNDAGFIVGADVPANETDPVFTAWDKDHADLTNVTTDQHHAQSHSIASHDTTATGAELETLTDNSIANALHRHSELVASDGFPDPALSVDAIGEVGIGTSTPDSRLEISVGGECRLKVTNSFAHVETILVSGGVYGLVGTFTDHQLFLVANNDIKMTLLSNGDVGIGTVVPGKLLEVDGDAGYVDATDMGVTDADFASKKYVDDTADTFTVLDEYDTGWLLNELGGAGVGEWKNVHLGDDPTGDSNVNHNLNAPLSDLDIHILVSTDGTDNNSFELDQVITWNASTVRYYGQQIYAVDDNNIQVQTGLHGAMYILANGVLSAITVNNWYYKIIVKKLTAGTTSPLISRTGTKTYVSNAGDNFEVSGQVSITGASRVRAKRTTAQTINHATTTTVLWNSEDYDNLGEYNPANGRFTPIEAGYYHVDASVLFSSGGWNANELIELHIYKNGAQYSRLYYHRVEATISQFKFAEGSDSIYLNGDTDYIEIKVYQSSGAALGLIADGTYNHFSVHRLS